LWRSRRQQRRSQTRQSSSCPKVAISCCQQQTSPMFSLSWQAQAQQRRARLLYSPSVFQLMCFDCLHPQVLDPLRVALLLTALGSGRAVAAGSNCSHRFTPSRPPLLVATFHSRPCSDPPFLIITSSAHSLTHSSRFPNHSQSLHVIPPNCNPQQRSRTTGAYASTAHAMILHAPA
jgi:hypothetical protein